MSQPKVLASATRQINAVVVSAGLMQKTVKARIGVQKWNNHIKKKFNLMSNVLVRDPNSSLRIGDIISISPGWRYSKRVHHVVNSIVAPFGARVEERPSVPTLEERLEEREKKRRAKEERKRIARGGKPKEVKVGKGSGCTGRREEDHGVRGEQE
ncbi:hypothetical protein PZA11_007623 [Diplocarpon coronariae]